MEKVIVEGKTKTLYDLGNGYYKLFFKDDLTGVNGVFDPGANEVGLTLKGAGMAGLKVSVYFFELLKKAGFNTHYVSSDIAERTMVVKPSKIFGKGLEVICRYCALGSFVRRYGSLVQEDAPLPALVEMTIKSDSSGDPLITQETLEVLGVLKPGEYSKLSTMTKDICQLVKEDLSKKGLELCDIKLEFGYDKNGEIMLIDEFSAGNMRVRKKGRIVTPLEFEQEI